MDGQRELKGDNLLVGMSENNMEVEIGVGLYSLLIKCVD